MLWGFQKLLVRMDHYELAPKSRAGACLLVTPAMSWVSSVTFRLAELRWRQNEMVVVWRLWSLQKMSAITQGRPHHWKNCIQERSEHWCMTWVFRDHTASWGRCTAWTPLPWGALCCLCLRTGMTFLGRDWFQNQHRAMGSHRSAMKCLIKAVMMTQEDRAAL